MAYKFKKMSDVDLQEKSTDITNLYIEESGKTKRLPADTFLCKKTVETVILDTTKLNSSGRFNPSYLDLIPGKKYKIYLDDGSYEDICKMSGDGSIYIGRYATSLLENNNEFSFFAGLSKTSLKPYLISDFNKGTNVKITRIDEDIIDSINPSSLPESLQFGENTIKVEIVNCTINSGYETSFTNYSLIPGMRYVVNVDGIEYDLIAEECTAVDEKGDTVVIPFVGNPSLISTASNVENNSLPFVYFAMYKESYNKIAGEICFSEERNYNIKIDEYRKVVNTIDQKYLPKAASIADVTTVPTAEEFNALLASLRAAGYLAE
jgi:hypothetical protein